MRRLRQILGASAITAGAAGLAVGWLLLGPVVVARAQTDPAQPPAEPAAADQQPAFRAGTTLVRTDAIVRDAQGGFIADLTRDEFIVEEDGVRQEVASLVLVHGGRVYNKLMPQARGLEGVILPTQRAVDDTPGRIIVIFVDELHVEPGSTPKLRHFIKTVGEALIHEGDLFGLVSNGPRATEVDLTYDRSRLEDAANSILGHGYGPRKLILEIQGGRDGPAELRWRAHRAFKTVYDVVRNLEMITDRRKVLVYISTGYDLNPFALQRLYRTNESTDRLRDRDAIADTASGGEFANVAENPIVKMERQGAIFADTELIAELDELAAAANRANTTFYTMDPRGLVSSPDLDYDVPLDEWREYMGTARSSLRTLAELTGGLSIVNTSNFDELLKQIDAETSDYYILGFYASDPDPSERTRQLRVSVTREGATVRSRTSYTFARTPAGAP